ncbi:hypothetical protein J8J14_09135 [Roseomonas sp. SSH11]|uniref:Uncharacterized protein n=1 Tax=Pararoseomonas baculiformis TaxID=2820812 RepID=A0ABS4AD96_9PROT|nr:hypothetical protein [Pararoseomonas baculiformis]MBP0444946.1 hypothetical protein [Pararoseomonas baculiformis]
MMRWALGLAILFGALALVARLLQLGLSLLLIVVAGIALLAAIGSAVMARSSGRKSPPDAPP